MMETIDRVAVRRWSGSVVGRRSHRPVCGTAPLDFARCHADVVTDAAGAPLTTSVPAGYGPSDLRAAYGLSSTAGGAQTVAIVDA
jgi:hypothetical protein